MPLDDVGTALGRCRERSDAGKTIEDFRCDDKRVRRSVLMGGEAFEIGDRVVAWISVSVMHMMVRGDWAVGLLPQITMEGDWRSAIRPMVPVINPEMPPRA